MTNFMLRTTIVVAALGLAGISPSAEAQSQQGGLPTVSARVSAVEGIAATLQGAVTTLQTQLTALQTANSNLQTANNNLQTANNNLQTALSAEIAARVAADAALQAAINSETAQRTADVQELRGLINAAGSKAFSTFRGQSALANGASGGVGAIGPLPAGNYLVTAKAVIQELGSNTSWTCTLRTEDGRAIDRTSGFNASHTGNASIVENVAMATLTAPGSIIMICGTEVAGPSCELTSCSSVVDIAMVAVQVGEAQISCADVFNCPAN